MTWINPLDRGPQVPQDWANHIIQGGALGIVAALIAMKLLPHFDPWSIGTGMSFFVCAVKKVFDYFKEDESVQMCVGKTFITALWPATIWLFAR